MSLNSELLPTLLKPATHSLRSLSRLPPDEEVRSRTTPSAREKGGCRKLGKSRERKLQGRVQSYTPRDVHTETPPHGHTYTHTCTRKDPGCQSLPPPGGHGDIKERPGIHKTFQSFLGLGQGHWTLGPISPEPRWL